MDEEFDQLKKSVYYAQDLAHEKAKNEKGEYYQEFKDISDYLSSAISEIEFIESETELTGNEKTLPFMKRINKI